LVLSSRWESGPIVAFEALAAGAAVIGPEWVPACRWVCDGQLGGTLFRKRSAAALGSAIVREVDAWRGGERDPAKIVAAWRPRLDPVAACRTMLGDQAEERPG
jgi:hypothetical protein